jgi:hypothetical protein
MRNRAGGLSESLVAGARRGLLSLSIRPFVGCTVSTKMDIAVLPSLSTFCIDSIISVVGKEIQSVVLEYDSGTTEASTKVIALTRHAKSWKTQFISWSPLHTFFQ